MITSRTAERSATPGARRRELLMVACAWGVHLYTGLGAVLGLFSIYYAALGDFRASFIAMGIATAIDSTDGPLARTLRVSERVPAFDGALLDNVVDYLTYVVAPVFLMLRAQLLAAGWPGLAMASGVILASAYGFCHTSAKGEYFRGFPSYWNLVAFYLYCLGFAASTNMIIAAVLALMVLTPVRYIYPNRTAPLRNLTLMLGTVWAGVTFAMLPELPTVNPGMLYVSLSFIAYYFIASFALHVLTHFERESAAANE